MQRRLGEVSDLTTRDPFGPVGIHLAVAIPFHPALGEELSVQLEKLRLAELGSVLHRCAGLRSAAGRPSGSAMGHWYRE